MNNLRIAIQKSGRLSERSLELIKECGIDFNNGTGKLKSEASNFPAEILFLRDDDIPGYVADGVADLGIIGENVMVEKDQPLKVIQKLGFSKCRLSIAIPRSEAYEGVQSLQGKHIATSYPRLLGKFLESQQIQATIHEISGSVEIAPSIGLANAVCDIVSSGSTLLSNGLKEVEVIFRSEAVLVSNAQLSPEKEALMQRLLFRLQSVQAAKKNKYILLNCPNSAIERIKQVLPGMKSPTVMPLAEEGWSSLHSVIHEDDFWNIIENLKAAGAEGILVVPIEKMIH